MKHLIVIEGFDRCGKDTLMNDLYNVSLPNTYIYFNDLEGLPKYDKEQEDFLTWLNKFVNNQVITLNKLFNKYDNVVMTRLILSDEVYSTLFNREHTTIKYMEQLPDIDIRNYCLLFNDYNEYIKRLQIIKDDNIQYNKEDFDHINKLYSDIITKLGYKYYINYIMANTTPSDILNDFINYIKNIENE